MIRLCSVGIGLDNYSDVFNAAVDPGIARQVLGAAGNYRGDFVAVLKQNMTAGFSLRDIAALDAFVFTTGKLFYRAEVAGDVAGSTYISLTSVTDKCMVVPQSISWSAGGLATMSVMMMFLSSDGDAAPVTVGTASGNLDAVSNVYVGAGSCIESININFGYSFRGCQDGKLYPHNIFVQAQQPSMTIVTSDETGLTTGKIAPGEIATLTASFQPVAEGGVRGTPRSYALTGHVQRNISGDRPGLITLSCAGKGGFTIS